MQMEVEVYLVQETLRESLGVSVLCAIVVSTLKQYSHYKSNEDVVTTVEDIIGENRYA